MDGSAKRRLEEKHAETGAGEIKTEKQKKKLKAAEKRKKSGDGNIEDWTTKKKGKPGLGSVEKREG